MTSAESGSQRGRHSVNPFLSPRNDCNLQSVKSFNRCPRGGIIPCRKGNLVQDDANS